ncbi:MAG: hemolysin D [Bacteroidetes bacterium]|nr:hemolysin D [Bacteroidota bacterium]
MNSRQKEELANVLSHAIGIGLAVAGAALLITFGAIYGDAWHVVSFSVFGACLVILYTASTVFHSARNARLRYALNKLDHSSIFILIAGSYTPIALVTLRGAFGWVIFGLIWAFAIAGVIFKLFYYTHQMRKLSTWLYICMGWLIIIAIVPLIKNTPAISLWFFLAGVLSYSGGAFFYIKRRVPYFHFIFHLFVLGGSICHFFGFLYLLPLN